MRGIPRRHREEERVIRASKIGKDQFSARRIFESTKISIGIRNMFNYNDKKVRPDISENCITTGFPKKQAAKAMRTLALIE